MEITQFSQESIEHPDRCEDALVIFDGANSTPTRWAPVFAVIDGMGGHQHRDKKGNLVTGREAAQVIRDVLIEDLEHLPADIDAGLDGRAQQAVSSAIRRAHQRVYQELNSADDLDALHRVGAVLTVAVVCENGKRILVAQIGDTRGYMYSDGELIQLCTDEDNIELLVRQHGLSEEDAEKVSAIVNAYDGVHEPKADGTIRIGGQEFDLYMAWRWFVDGNPALNIPAANVVINTLGLTEADPVLEQSRIEISTGDILCLCSDGLYKNLSDQEIVSGLKGTGDLATALGNAALGRSKDSSNRRMNPDDISAIAIRF